MKTQKQKNSTQHSTAIYEHWAKVLPRVSSRKLGEKTSILHCECMETVVLERIWWFIHYFIIKKNIRLDTRLRKPNYESSLLAIIEKNYFKGKIWVLK